MQWPYLKAPGGKPVEARPRRLQKRRPLLHPCPAPVKRDPAAKTALSGPAALSGSPRTGTLRLVDQYPAFAANAVHTNISLTDVDAERVERRQQGGVNWTGNGAERICDDCLQ